MVLAEGGGILVAVVQVVGLGFVKVEGRLRGGARLVDRIVDYRHLRAGATSVDRIVGLRSLETYLLAEGLLLNRESFAALERPSSPEYT